MNTFKIPSPVAIALQTGRPELARIGIQMGAAGLTQAQIDELAEYAEALVHEIQREREVVTLMLNQVQNTLSNIKGSLFAVSRLEDALRLMQQGAAPEIVAQALTNPNTESV
jgi:hypothetical protein